MRVTTGNAQQAGAEQVIAAEAGELLKLSPTLVKTDRKGLEAEAPNKKYENQRTQVIQCPSLTQTWVCQYVYLKCKKDIHQFGRFPRETRTASAAVLCRMRLVDRPVPQGTAASPSGELLQPKGLLEFQFWDSLTCLFP